MNLQKSLIDRARSIGMDMGTLDGNRATRRKILKARMKKNSHARSIMIKREGKRKSIADSL